EHDLGLVLLQEPLGCLRRRERAACRILVLDLEPVAVDSGLVELLDRKLDALLVLDPEIGPRARHREQAPDPDHLVLRGGVIRSREQENTCSHTDTQNWKLFSLAPPPRVYLFI